jgi:hypothetical protein
MQVESGVLHRTRRRSIHVSRDLARALSASRRDRLRRPLPEPVCCQIRQQSGSGKGVSKARALAGEPVGRREVAEGDAGASRQARSPCPHHGHRWTAGPTVFAQDGHQVAPVPDQGPVQQLASAAADPAFHDRVHSRRLNRGADHPDASGLEDGVECGGEAGVPVMQDELHARPSIFQLHEQVPGLLHHPCLDRMLGGPEDPDAAGAVLDHGQDVGLRASEQVGGEEVQSQDPLRLGPRNSAQPGPSLRGAGLMPASLRICQTVDGATVMPSPASSPWIRR